MTVPTPCPGARKFLVASSSTRTQSVPGPLDGGVNVLVPVLANVPIEVATPVRGSNHQACTFPHTIVVMATVMAWPSEM